MTASQRPSHRTEWSRWVQSSGSDHHVETIWSIPVVTHTVCTFTWERSSGLPGGQLWLRPSFPFGDVQHVSRWRYPLPPPCWRPSAVELHIPLYLHLWRWLSCQPTAPEGHLYNLLKSSPFLFASHVPEAQQVGVKTPLPVPAHCFQIRAPSTSTKTKPPKRLVYSVAQSYLTLCNPMDCRLPGFSVPGTFQARIL